MVSVPMIIWLRELEMYRSHESRFSLMWHRNLLLLQPGIWASTSTRWYFAFALCFHSNETRTPIANLPNITQLGGTPYHYPKLHPGPVQ